jgi:cyclophilin family peptidyl-prolyl cis-trans isomerase
MRRIVCAVLLAALVPLGFAAAQGTKTTTAVITMESGGLITLEFWPDVAPNHVKNFIDLVGKGFYDGQRVHRVEPKFVVQFGKMLKAEFNKKPFDRGVLGMARTNDPDSASSQVYLMLGDSHFLNGQYTAFGRVTKGMDVVDKIKVGDRIKSIKVQ